MEPVTIRVTDVIRLDDQGLIQRARSGDAEAFDAIAARRIPDAYRLASAILGSQAAAADATQNALLAAWRELPRLRDVDAFDAWFHRILVNECRMQVRHQTRLRETELTESGPDAAASHPQGKDASTLELVEVLDLLEGAFERLEPDDRAMVVLHHLEGRPLTEIAALLHMPVGTVKWRLHQARGVLQHALEAVE
ncbi:MAG TPA: RNA polymerase sigma factor [Candidatus Limnocylindrales bacterium]